MTVAEWSILVGAALALGLALAPWMFMVHAKLAVVSTQIGELADKVDRLIEADAQRVPNCARHREKLEQLGRRVDALEAK